MKITTLQIRFNAEKLDAIQDYMVEKNLNVEDELTDCLAKLYDKHVPANVREYIEKKQAKEQKSVVAALPKKSRPNQTDSRPITAESAPT